MKIIIDYESSWRNSFLDGSNNEPLPKTGRNFIASMTSLKKEGNYIVRDITKDTIMGVLNRLIGEQRKLYQARQDPNYYFRKIEQELCAEHIIDEPVLTDEIVFLRNMSGCTDQNSFAGLIKGNDPAFCSDFSEKLWGILFLELPEIFNFYQNADYQVNKKQDSLDPITVINQLESLNELKPINLEGQSKAAYKFITAKFEDVDFKLTTKEQFTPISFYTAALYVQLERLAQQYDLSKALTKIGGLSGISKRGFTKKDFMARYTTGDKKLIWGNPYILSQRIKGEGEVKSLLKKASGRLTINLDIAKKDAEDLEQKINDAAVSAFYIGKKGLAYLVAIEH